MKKPSSDNKSLFNPAAPTLLIVISGPSGVGKDVVLTRMRETGLPAEYITTVTTRPQRATERDRVDYHFTSTERFQELIDNNELLEWANVYGNWYGVPKQPIEQALNQGQDTVVKVDIQGAATIKKALPQALFIFLMPPSLEELEKRLRLRGTDCEEALIKRLGKAGHEMQFSSEFDHILVNHNLNEALSEAESVVRLFLAS